MPRYKQCILGTCVVPWREDDTLDEPMFRESIDHLIDRGLPDLYVFGTAGEGYAMDDELFDQVTRAFADQMLARGATPMVGVVSLSLRTILKRIERAGKLGVRAFQISLPSWGALNDQELDTFFREVCGRFPEFQFLHYNLMRTKRIVKPDEYARLMRDNPNLVATKVAAGDEEYVRELLAKASDMMHFVGEQRLAFGNRIGPCGLLISVAATNLTTAREFFDACVRRDPIADEYTRELLGVNKAIADAVDPTIHMDGAYDKMIAKIAIPRFPLRLLPPYQSSTDAMFERYRDTLRAHFPRWIEES